MVMGNSEEMMACAARAVAEEGGGMAVAAGEQRELLPLPVAGLMSPEPYDDVAERSKAIGEALVLLPELHVSGKGLVGVSESGFGFVEPFDTPEGTGETSPE
jgi:adenine deaminase